MTRHELKVARPYFAALLDGTKTFEVRRNDRAFQRGDRLVLWDVGDDGQNCPPSCDDARCSRRGEAFEADITFVYSGDPRFGGMVPGFVVLGIAASSSTPETP